MIKQYYQKKAYSRDLVVYIPNSGSLTEVGFLRIRWVSCSTYSWIPNTVTHLWNCALLSPLLIEPWKTNRERYNLSTQILPILSIISSKSIKPTLRIPYNRNSISSSTYLWANNNMSTYNCPRNGLTIDFAYISFISTSSFSSNYQGVQKA